MVNASEVERALRESGMPLSGPVVEDAGLDRRYYVFLEISRDSRGRQQPSNVQLNQLRHLYAESGVELVLVLMDSGRRDAEAGLRATLLHAFGGTVRNVFLSSSADQADVWIEPKRSLDSSDLSEIAERAGVFLTGVGLRLREICSTVGENLPSKVFILRSIRTLAPARIDDVRAAAQSAGFEVPSEDWLRRRLDSLRKSGFLVWIRTDKYALTIKGLKALGTSKDRNSPDLTRLLALARRGD